MDATTPIDNAAIITTTIPLASMPIYAIMFRRIMKKTLMIIFSQKAEEGMR